ncbi:hypothetical protein C7N43_04990 [Sphingobacteriales bacterium UPWRP_1]|nr:hypothetical protein BVG80_06915 [Sphingobacteriales bacterium TSM_CSM]PSJ78178.1 hypothetical protein C7N43_04990 [Sphingobacteriales bacterium UPWRP_1]
MPAALPACLYPFTQTFTPALQPIKQKTAIFNRLVKVFNNLLKIFNRLVKSLTVLLNNST